ncbi:MAG: TolC family protein [Gemmataceae bacterium]
MSRHSPIRAACVALPLSLLALGIAHAQQPAPFTPPTERQGVAFTPPPVDAAMRPLAINLPTALQLAGSSPLDVAAASERLRLATAQLREARTLWLPNVQWGVDYFRHDGRIQDVVGNVFEDHKGAFFAGMAPNAVFSVSEAIFAPLAARQVVRARQYDLQTAANDSMLAVAEAYMNVQQARGELSGAIEATRRTEELAKRTEELAKDLVAPLEAIRVNAELARRQQTEVTARERWRLASADLARVLRLDPAAQVEPLEPPQLRVNLLLLDKPVDEYIAIALTYRPELAAQQALVQAALKRLKQERLRPLTPSVLLRGAATNPAGTLSTGTFGGGVNGTVGNFGFRNDIDIQLVWQLDHLGVGSRAKTDQRRAENQLALVELFRVQDRVAAEANQAFAQAQSAAQRVELAERGLKLAVQSADLNFEALRQTKRAGETILTVVRPSEAVAAVQALGQAYTDYYAAVADANRAQFRLYRALGQPAQCIVPEAVPQP